MAESQGASAPDASTLDALDRSLSLPRLAPYLVRADGDRQLALKFYLWNARLSKAFLYPLHVAEITVRNAMHAVLSSRYGGPAWIFSPPFPLTPESMATLTKAVRRLASRRARQGNLTPITPNDLVAALTFDFWSNLFRYDYDAEWSQPGLLKAVFQNLPSNLGRPDVQHLVAAVNDVRNRIAHHEPIHADPDISARSDDILRLIGWRCELTRDWVKAHSTIAAVLRAPPTAASTLPGLPLASTNLRAPLMLTGAQKLSDVLVALTSARPSIALVPDPSASPPYRAVTARDILAFFADKAGQQGSLLDLAEHVLDDVLGATVPQPLGEIDIKATTGDVLAAFFPRKTREVLRPRVLVVTDSSVSRRCVGLIVHPEVRY
ncbi:hypothetical protein ACI2KH_18165 [Roseomonas mucosa]|uniref:hypothetical protein n=1 Tax=Roseomonas mucosa TaxID=207340 RepID=UPI0038502397